MRKLVLALTLLAVAGCGPVSFIGKGKDAVTVEPPAGSQPAPPPR